MRKRGRKGSSFLRSETYGRIAVPAGAEAEKNGACGGGGSCWLCHPDGGIDKVLTPLADVPVLVHTLRVFQNCDDIDEIVVVTREDLLVEVSQPVQGLCP